MRLTETFTKEFYNSEKKLLIYGAGNYGEIALGGLKEIGLTPDYFVDKNHAGEGESSTDLVFAAHNMIAENGTILAEAKRFTNETVYAEIDLEKLAAERQRMNTFTAVSDDDYEICEIAADEWHNQIVCCRK